MTTLSDTQGISIYVEGDEIEAEWWTEDIADLLCDLCSLCSGWRIDPPIGCVIASRWCG